MIFVAYVAGIVTGAALSVVAMLVAADAQEETEARLAQRAGSIPRSWD